MTFFRSIRSIRTIRSISKPLLLGLALFLCFFIFTNQAHAGIIVKSPAYLGLQRGLVGCWNFDGSYTKAPDCSGNNNTGTLTGGPTKTTGKIGQALNFDGVDDYVRLDSPRYCNGCSYAISFWMNGSSGSGKTAYSEGRSSGSNPRLVMWDTDGDGFMNIDIRDNSNISLLGAESTSTVFNNQWHHVVFSDNAGSAKLYIDGVQDATNFAFTHGALTLNRQTLGVLGRDDDNFFYTGKIDEVRTYNRALSATEIQRLYRIGLGSTANRITSALDKGLVGHWTFDGPDISGTRAKDRSGNQNHGTLTGGPIQAIGRIGQALDFDGGNKCVAMTDTTHYTQTTTSSWIKPNSTASRPNIITKGGGGSFEWEIRYQETIGDKNLWFYVSFDGDDGQWKTPVGSVPGDTWSHIVVAYDNTNPSNDPDIYIDGVWQTVDVATPTGSADTGGFYNIGSTGACTSNFSGSIDDVRIYSRILSATEISRLYQSTQSKYNKTNTDALTRGLVGYWTFDGGDVTSATAKDRSGLSNHGFLNGGPTLAIGRIGQAMKFDGVDDDLNFLSAGNIDNIFQASPYTGTVAFWAKRNALGFMVLVNKNGNTGTTGWATSFAGSGGSHKFGFNHDVSTDNNSLGWRTNQSFTDLSAWNHFAVTFNGSSLLNDPIIYVNGVPSILTEAGNTAGSFISDEARNLKAGEDDSSTFNFNGTLDEIRLYNRILSASEIQKLYNMGR